MSIDFQRKEYETMLPVWGKIQKISDGRDVTDYIYDLNPGDTSIEMTNRNKDFRRRAVFYSITSYTIRGFLGLVYDTPPKITLPVELEYLLDNADGTGIGIVQQSQDVTNQVIRVGRSLLWADFPNTGGNDVSRAQMASGGVFATIQHFSASQVYFWSTRQVGAEVVLDDVRIYTSRQIKDGLALIDESIILRLMLDEVGNYAIETWAQNDKGEWVLDGDPKYPRDGSGSMWNRIPAVFVGAESNSWHVDQPPMEGIASLNAAHLNDSAIYQDSVLTVGQPQPWCSGYSLADLEELQQSNFYIGSRRLLTVPPGERFGFEQAKENPLAREAMRDKLDMMIGIGAAFVQPGTVAKTATQAAGEQRAQHSVLSLIAANVSDAYYRIIQYVAQYMRVSLDGDFVFELNQNYTKTDADYNMLREMVASFMQGAIPASDYHAFLVKNEITSEDKTTDEFFAELGTTGPLALDE